MQRSAVAAGAVAIATVIIAASAAGRQRAAAAVVGNSRAYAPATPPARAQASLHYVLAPRGNAARYFVREQLAGISFPSDAVGVTDSLSGSIVFGADGRVVSDSSRFVADVRGLKSDREMRDGYIQRRTLETDRYPTVTLVPTKVDGLTLPLPEAGRTTFTLVGNLTVHGVTRPTTWSVTAFLRDGQIRGTASTGFTFDDFQLQKPRVGSVLSVADSIHLAYDFDLVPGH